MAKLFGFLVRSVLWMLTHTLYRITSDERLNHRCGVLGGVLAEPCAALLRQFFLERRAEGKK